MKPEKNMENLRLGNIGESGCPCGVYKNRNFRIETHCWRTGRCCAFSGVHWSAKKGFEKKAKEHADKIAEYIRDSYMTEVRVTKSPRT